MVDQSQTLANLGSFLGLDGLIIMVASLVIYGVPVIGLVLLVRYLARTRVVVPPEQRLQKLDEMRSAKSITEAEYQEQRRRVLSEI